MGKHEQRRREKLAERKKAEAEALKATSHENDMRGLLMAHLVSFAGKKWADMVDKGVWKVRIHHLWADNYRVNFWAERDGKIGRTYYIQHSFFVKHSSVRGFYCSNPRFEDTFSE